MKSEIKRIEYYLPPKTEDGNTLKKDNPAWPIEEIEKRTGICSRRIADSLQTTADMALLSASKLFASGVKKKKIDFLIFVTQSPDYVLPTTACILQDRLGLDRRCMAFDVNLGCSGYIYGLLLGGALIEAGLAKEGLIICSEKYTQYIGKDSRTCRPIFSDGAASTLIGRSDKDGIGPFEMGTDGSGFNDLIVPPGGRLHMNGPKVFMFSIRTVPECVKALLKKSKKKIGDIDMFVFHQASKVVIDNIIRKLKLADEKVFMNCRDIGNTVSASIPIALKDASDKGCFKNGDDVMLVGFGVGYSWGGCLIKYGGKL